MVIKFNEPLGKPECPYAYRWMFATQWFSIRIHKWIRSDDKRFYHDHAWWFITFVLKGFYHDVSDNGTELMNAGKIKYRPAHHKHYVRVPESGCTTLLITGPNKHNWKFWSGDKPMKRYKYFKLYGHPECTDQ